MKKTKYTKKQITEAINHWKKVLRQMNESIDINLAAVGDSRSAYQTENIDTINDAFNACKRYAASHAIDANSWIAIELLDDGYVIGPCDNSNNWIDSMAREHGYRTNGRNANFDEFVNNTLQFKAIENDNISGNSSINTILDLVEKDKTILFVSQDETDELYCTYVAVTYNALLRAWSNNK